MVQKMTESKELSTLINQSLALIDQIQKHPDFQAVEYSPDLTLGDAQQALLELRWQTLPQSQPIQNCSLQNLTT
ncbi:hypothetical protein IQ240_18175 [Nodularia sp. LEGE 04288]|nr:hypothetical protein [Nodularia sp. LEGE 04288]